MLDHGEHEEKDIRDEGEADEEALEINRCFSSFLSLTLFFHPLYFFPSTYKHTRIHTHNSYPDTSGAWLRRHIYINTYYVRAEMGINCLGSNNIYSRPIFYLS